MGEGLCRVMLAVGWGKMVKSGSKALKSPSLLLFPAPGWSRVRGKEAQRWGAAQAGGLWQKLLPMGTVCGVGT